ncbi:hypothetical protein JTB14_031396 [Gonioctena quinquepunctata]|nr:hypothetical protein JTB14_031396 [Gonioctena quinquepunctata]
MGEDTTFNTAHGRLLEDNGVSNYPTFPYPNSHLEYSVEEVPPTERLHYEDCGRLNFSKEMGDETSKETYTTAAARKLDLGTLGRGSRQMDSE